MNFTEEEKIKVYFDFISSIDTALFGVWGTLVVIAITLIIKL